MAGNIWWELTISFVADYHASIRKNAYMVFVASHSPSLARVKLKSSFKNITSSRYTYKLERRGEGRFWRWHKLTSGIFTELMSLILKQSSLFASILYTIQYVCVLLWYTHISMPIRIEVRRIVSNGWCVDVVHYPWISCQKMEHCELQYNLTFPVNILMIFSPDYKPHIAATCHGFICQIDGKAPCFRLSNYIGQWGLRVIDIHITHNT